MNASLQALSIHEQRSTFVPTLWEKQEGAHGQVLEQVWFPGTHCDVGGGSCSHDAFGNENLLV